MKDFTPLGSTNSFQCVHDSESSAHGLCLVTIGNVLRTDDGIASALCNSIPGHTLLDVCRFDLGTHTGYLADCLKSHKAAIIIDCTKSGAEPGTVTITDLLSVLNKHARTPMLKSTHALSFLEELMLIKRSGELPKTLVLFGIEASSDEWSCALSEELKGKLPALALRLSLLVEVIQKSLNKDA